MIHNRVEYSLIHMVFAAFISFSMMGCGGNRCLKFQIKMNSSTSSVSKTISYRASQVINELFDHNRDPMPHYFYEKRISILPAHSDNPFICTLEYRYTGGGDLMIWGAHELFERHAVIRVLDAGDGGCVIDLVDCGSKEYTIESIGNSVVDALVPLVFPGKTGEVEIHYKSGRLYAKGELVDGVREGEWRWWFEDGQLMQKVDFKNGEYHGDRMVYYKRGDSLQMSTVGYENGKIVNW